MAVEMRTVLLWAYTASAPNGDSHGTYVRHLCHTAGWKPFVVGSRGRVGGSQKTSKWTGAAATWELLHLFGKDRRSGRTDTLRFG
jgi:hypothetical protein